MQVIWPAVYRIGRWLVYQTGHHCELQHEHRVSGYRILCHRVGISRRSCLTSTQATHFNNQQFTTTGSSQIPVRLYSLLPPQSLPPLFRRCPSLPHRSQLLRSNGNLPHHRRLQLNTNRHRSYHERHIRSSIYVGSTMAYEPHRHDSRRSLAE